MLNSITPICCLSLGWNWWRPIYTCCSGLRSGHEVIQAKHAAHGFSLRMKMMWHMEADYKANRALYVNALTVAEPS